MVGRAFMIVWPPSRWRVLPIPATFGQPGCDEREPAADAALAAGDACRSAAPLLPLGLGFAGAVPLTWLQRRLRLRPGARRGLAARARAAAGPVEAGSRMRAAPWRHPGYTPRRGGGLTGYERVLARAGLAPVAGIDEAGRGACAGPLVVGAVILDPRKPSRLDLLADSKALTAAVREEAYDQVMAAALSWHVVVIPAGDIDRLRAARLQHRRDAPGPGGPVLPAGVRADRRFPGPRPGRPRAGHVEGR